MAYWASYGGHALGAEIMPYLATIPPLPPTFPFQSCTSPASRSNPRSVKADFLARLTAGRVAAIADCSNYNYDCNGMPSSGRFPVHIRQVSASVQPFNLMQYTMSAWPSLPGLCFSRSSYDFRPSLIVSEIKMDDQRPCL
jgi:hypothetical protein